MSEAEAKKRPASPSEDIDSDSDDGWIGPTLSEAAPVKKKKALPFENVYLENLPHSDTYERSFMHRDVVSWCLSSGSTCFVITGSVDGHVKFWKKQEVGLEFVKHFRAHIAPIKHMTINSNGTLMITVSEDKHGKVFDVVNFDMINILAFDYAPEVAAWVHQPGDAIQAVAIAGNTDSPSIRIYDGRGASTPLKVIEKMHMKPVSCMIYNATFDVAISADRGGMIEYWRGPKGDYGIPKNVAFESKIDTDLYEFAKNKTYITNMTLSPDGKFFATFAADKKIRVFRFLMGKLYCVIDESLHHYIGVQQKKQMMPSMEFNRKVSNEKDMEKSEVNHHCNIIFDSTGHFIMYATMIGIKLVNLYTNKVKTIIGKNENLRFINLALCQNDTSSTAAIPDMKMQASENPTLSKTDLSSDPTLICCAFRKNRFYLLSRRNGDHSTRDIFNEKPTHEDKVAVLEESTAPKLYESATIHTDQGDIIVKLFPRECPKTVENFCGLAKNNYYNGCIFHRIIKQFMVQTGDPTGIGTGGESLWGGEFEDEFHPKLKHDRPYTLSMANAGPNTNGSQFFITVVPCSWLDNKHTIFGRVVAGMETVIAISNVKTHPKTDKPYDEIKIVSVSLREAIKL